MKKHTVIIVIFVLVMLTGAIVGISVVHATESRVAYTLPWSVISSGGMGGTAGSYIIHSTLGQPVAGSGAAGDYSFTSGFWTEVVEFIEQFFNFLPVLGVFHSADFYS